jgi:hypothetical protein
VLAIALAAVALAAPPPTPGTSLRVTVRDPLTLHAAGFGRRETVRVTVETRRGTTVRTIKATLRGRFVVRFPGVALDGASDLDVSAVGSRGHRASFSVRHTTGGAVSKI